MRTIKILGMIVLLLALEAFNDAAVYKSWVLSNNWGFIAHITQIVLLLATFMFGIMYALEEIAFCKNKEIIINFVFLSMGYLLIRFGLFDLFYNEFSSNDSLGSTSLSDLLYKKLPILNNVLVRLSSAFIGTVVMSIRFR